MSDAEKKQLDDAEVAKVQGGRRTIEIRGEEFALYEGDPNVTIYCPECEGTVFGYQWFLGLTKLRCAGCGYSFWKDVEGSASIGSDW